MFNLFLHLWFLFDFDILKEHEFIMLGVPRSTKTNWKAHCKIQNNIYLPATILPIGPLGDSHCLWWLYSVQAALYMHAGTSSSRPPSVTQRFVEKMRSPCHIFKDGTASTTKLLLQRFSLECLNAIWLGGTRVGGRVGAFSNIFNIWNALFNIVDSFNTVQHFNRFNAFFDMFNISHSFSTFSPF